MKAVELTIICSESQEEAVISQLNDLQIGLYSMGCTRRNATACEDNEVRDQVPDDVLEEYEDQV